MYSVFKRKKRVKGVLVEYKNYSLRYRIDPMLSPKTVSLGVSDKSVAEIKGAELYSHFQKVEAGLALPLDVIDSQKLPLSEHVKDFCSELEVKGRSEAYIYNCGKLLMKFFRETSCSTLQNITSDAFESWRKENASKSAKTLNSYRAFLLEFMKWHMKHKRVPSNPIELVDKVKKCPVPERARRALSENDLRKLVSVDPDRGLVYLTAAFTGLRRKELSNLEWQDVDFNKEVIRARASTTKNNKDAILPMLDGLNEALKSFKGLAKSSDRVFIEIPSVPQLKEDLEACGLLFIDENGRRFDFHSLRVTFCTLLSCSGVGLRVAQSLMRHSDPKLTSQVYTDENLLPMREAIEKLPSFSKRGTPIGTRISDNSSQNESEAVASNVLNSMSQNDVNLFILNTLDGISQKLSQGDRRDEKSRPTRTRT